MSEHRGIVRASVIFALTVGILLVLSGASAITWTSQRAALRSATITADRYDRYCQREFWFLHFLDHDLSRVSSEQEGWEFVMVSFDALESRGWRSTALCIPDGVALGGDACDGDIPCMEAATTKAILYMGLGH